MGHGETDTTCAHAIYYLGHPQGDGDAGQSLTSSHTKTLAEHNEHVLQGDGGRLIKILVEAEGERAGWCLGAAS